jgi:phosphoribosylglycinamide formyltransferase-1
MGIGDTIRIGVILSAGGSAFAEAARIAASLPLEFYLLTDRPCGAEARCRELSIPVMRVEESDNVRFSLAAKEHFLENRVELVLLHFSRLITPELFRTFPCCNVHPALLPAFPGFSAVKRDWSGGGRFIGATLHYIDEGVDSGPIIAQAVTPIPTNADLQWCERASFLQKVLVTLILFELIVTRLMSIANRNISSRRESLPHSPSANPTLTHASLVEGFQALQSGLGFEVFP